MTLSELRRLMSPTHWVLVSAIAFVLAFGLWFFVTEPGRANQRAAEARAAGAFSEARTGSAAEAGAILDQAHGAASAGEQLSRETSDVISSAPGADQRLDPDLNRVARERVCLRPAYRGTAECVQLLGVPKP